MVGFWQDVIWVVKMNYYIHHLHDGPFDGDKVPNHRPWENLVVTKYCPLHKEDKFSYDFEKCPDCKKHKYLKSEIVDYRVDMIYEGEA